MKSAHLLERSDAPASLLDIAQAFCAERHGFFLDSGVDPEGLGRFSMVGGRPFLVLRAKDREIELAEAGVTTRHVGDPFETLRGLLSRYHVDPAKLLRHDLPFIGGAVGSLGYELSQHIETLPRRAVDDLGLPDCTLLFVDSVVIYDHARCELLLSAVGFGTSDVESTARAQRALERLRERVAAVPRRDRSVVVSTPSSAALLEGDPLCGGDLEVRSLTNPRDYRKTVEEAKEHILAGNAFEICTTHRLDCDFDGDPWRLYETLRQLNPAPFASFLHLDDTTVVSASPERFLRVDRSGRAQSRPIKGTIARGRNLAEDARHRERLHTSEKDRAENLMIVDLVRNDFGRVCELGSIEVTELMAIEAYATVFQMVSTIEGQLAEGRDAIDLLRATWPGGSMTGAPKISAMKIIDALEPVRRGIFSGSIGTFDFAGHVDLNIVIRTILLVGGLAYLQVGGAVVADSDPQDEYQETLDKARAPLAALRASAAGRGSNGSRGSSRSRGPRDPRG